MECVTLLHNVDVLLVWQLLLQVRAEELSKNLSQVDMQFSAEDLDKKVSSNSAHYYMSITLPRPC